MFTAIPERRTVELRCFTRSYEKMPTENSICVSSLGPSRSHLEVFCVAPPSKASASFRGHPRSRSGLAGRARAPAGVAWGRPFDPHGKIEISYRHRGNSAGASDSKIVASQFDPRRNQLDAQSSRRRLDRLWQRAEHLDSPYGGGVARPRALRRVHLASSPI